MKRLPTLLFALSVALMATVRFEPASALDFQLTGLEVSVGGEAVAFNETVSASRTRYTVDVPSDTTNVSVKASWTPFGTCNGQDQSGCSVFSPLNPRPDFTTWQCSNCATSYEVETDITVYARPARAYWANSETADWGQPSRLAPLTITNGGTHVVDGSNQSWQWLIVRFDYEIHFDYRLGLSGAYYWLDTDTFHESFRYAIKVRRGSPASTQPRIKLAKRAAGFETFLHPGGKQRYLTPVYINVKLDRAPTTTVTVDWTTRDPAGSWNGAGAARAGQDYKAASGTVTFAPGERKKEISVDILDDSMDEGPEYFEVVYSNPSGAVFDNGRRYTYAIIRNSDPLQRDWLARMGRTVAGQVVDAVSARREPGVWSHASYDAFGSENVSGQVATALVGAEAALGDLTVGAAFAASDADGEFAYEADSGHVEHGQILASPYARYTISNRFSVWGLAGIGTGVMAITQDVRGEAPERRTHADSRIRLMAFGARGKLLSQEDGDQIDLSLLADTFFVRMESAAVPGSAQTVARAKRSRVGIEAAHDVRVMGAVTLIPSLSLGLRHDDGDAEAGMGVEVAGGVRYEDPSGLTGAVQARSLIAHEDASYEDWGVDLEIEYIVGALVPYVATSLHDGETLRTGVRWAPTPSVNLGLEATQDTGGHALMLESSVSW